MVATLTGPTTAPPEGVATYGAQHSWLIVGLVGAARAYRAFLLTLVTVAMAPMLWGWSSYVVTSGSMAPSLSIGDVAVAAPLPAGAPVPMGRVMIFTNPAKPDSTVPLIHRVVATKGARFVTAGDANAADDTMPVPRAMFRAQARILVPWVGLPLTWLSAGRFLPLALWLLLTVTAFLLAPLPRSWPHRGTPPGPSRSRRPAGAPRRASRMRSRLPRGRATRSLAVGVVAAVLALTSATASAGFHVTTRNGSNRWVATTAMVQPYNTQVLADGAYLYYLLDEASGTTAADYSGNNRPGTYASVGTYLQPGALAHNFGYSIGLNAGTGRVIGASATTGQSNPTTFTLELWFKTSTASGGKLIGFENSKNATSTTADRHVFMGTNGRIYYGGWSNSGTQTIITPKAYNDGSWHYLVLTAKPSGSQQTSILYVDGVSVASGTTTRTSSYTGWWRLGYGTLLTGGIFPSANFTGQIDNAAVYMSVLTPTQIAAHYAAR